MKSFEEVIESLIDSREIIVRDEQFHATRGACLTLFAWCVTRARAVKDGMHDLIVENVLDYGEKHAETVLIPLMLGQEPKYSMVDVTCSYIRELLLDYHSTFILDYAERMEREASAAAHAEFLREDAA